MLAMLLTVCLTLPPVSGPVAAGFAPGETHGGHWGVDFAVSDDTVVVAPAPGVVTFAGTVAGMRSVTILIEPNVRVSMSYLSRIDVSVGHRVSSGSVVGRSGLAHGLERLHMSVRVGDRYVDPAPFMRCGGGRDGTIRLLPDR